jgi:ADP-ribose pyrophosphatase
MLEMLYCCCLFVIVMLTEEEKHLMDLRRYPVRPHVGVGGVIRWHDSVLLVHRQYDPDAGKWAIPGGHLELGESMAEGALRECVEETGLKLRVREQTPAIDKIMRDADGKIQYHYILVDFMMELVGDYSHDHPPVPIAQSDAKDAKFVPLSELPEYNLTDSVQTLFRILGYMD